MPKSIDAFRMVEGPTKYTADTLFEYIDGGADAFLQFDFEELATATYANARKIELRVDLYRHRDANRAFGMYALERASGTTMIPIGVEGHGGQDYLHFVVGPYYAKLTLAGARDASLLRAFAERFVTALPGTREPPTTLRVFPNRGKRLRAEKLASRDFLGHSFLHDAVAVPYELDGVRFRLFVIQARDEADVREMVKRYFAIEKGSGVGAGVGAATGAAPGAAGGAAGTPGAAGGADQGLASAGSATVRDPLNGQVALRWRGPWLWGAVDGSSASLSALLDELGRNLSAMVPPSRSQH